MVKRYTRKWQWKRFGTLRKTFFKWVFKLTLPVAILGLGAGIFFGVRRGLYVDPYFQIERVSVFPTSLISAAEHRSLDAGLRGKNLLQVDLGAISRKLEQNPGVKRAEIVRSFPNQIKIFLTPRTSLVQVQSVSRGPYYSVSEDRVIVSVSQVSRPGFTIIEDFSGGRKSYVRGMIYQNPYFPEWEHFFNWFYQDPVLKTEAVNRFSVDRLGNMTAVLADGIELRFGRIPGLQGNAGAVLRRLLHSEERKQILYLDLRYQDVIVKQK